MITAKAASVASTAWPSRADQALRRLEDHEGREDEQQSGLDQRRDALDLAVAVVMLLVGRLSGDAHRVPGHHGRDEVERRVRGLGDQRERAGQRADERLGDRQAARGCDRRECDPFLVSCIVLCIPKSLPALDAHGARGGVIPEHVMRRATSRRRLVHRLAIFGDQPRAQLGGASGNRRCCRRPGRPTTRSSRRASRDRG